MNQSAISLASLTRRIEDTLDRTSNQSLTDTDQIPIDWYAVCWDSTTCKFNLQSLRREPVADCDSRHPANPRLWKQPFLFPWIYLPAAPNLLILTAKHHCVPAVATVDPAADFAVTHAVHWLNSVCSWQTHVTEISQHVSRLGGILLQHAEGGFIPDWTPTPRYRSAVVTKARNRTRSSALPHTTLKNVVRREGLAARRLPDLQTPPAQPVSRPQGLIPPAAPTPPRLAGHGFTEDERRQYFGLTTLTDDILQALSSQAEQEQAERERLALLATRADQRAQRLAAPHRHR